MRLVQRGNKQLRVEDDRVEDMLRDGYVEVDSRTGKPIVPEPRREGRRTKLPGTESGD